MLNGIQSIVSLQYWPAQSLNFGYLILFVFGKYFLINKVHGICTGIERHITRSQNRYTSSTRARPNTIVRRAINDF